MNLIDVAIFGEIGLCAVHRPEGRPAPIPAGKIRAPQGSPRRGDRRRHRAHAGRHDRFRRTDGAAPCVSAAAPSNRSRSYFRIGDDGTVDTGYPCSADPQTGALVVTGPPAGLVSVGGYRFCMRDVQDVVTQTDDQASVAALPDAFAGHRLAGASRDRAAMRRTLAAIGLNPLIVRAFRDRTAPRFAGPLA